LITAVTIVELCAVLLLLLLLQTLLRVANTVY
jgi:hypothetical protein